MLTWALSFLIIAILIGVFSLIAAGPAGPILFFVFLALFFWSFIQHLRERNRGPRR